MSASNASNGDRPKTQTELEMETGRKSLERYTAQRALPPKKTDGAMPATTFPVGETIDTGIVAPVTANQPQGEGVRRETPPPERSAAPKAVPDLAGPALNVVGGSTPAEKSPRPDDGHADDKVVNNLGKPTPIPPEFVNFPAELKSLPNWVLWRYLPPKSSGQKWRKVPFRPNGKTADTTNRSTWSQFEECRTAYARGGFDGVGFVFDGEIGADGLCYCGVDFDSCSIENGKEVDSLALRRIKRLNTYTECSVSGTGIHCIARAGPLDRIVKFDGVEIYTKARYFTFTGRSLGEIKTAPTEICALVDEVRAKEAAAKQQQSAHSNSKEVPTTDLADPFKNGPDPAFAELDPRESLAEGIRTTPWFEILPPELKDKVVDHALEVIAKNTCLLELGANGGNNAEYHKLTTSVARSGAPNAEGIFVKHASSAKDADPEEALRQYFSRCRTSQPLGNRGITVGTLLLLAQQNGANFDQWKCQAPRTPALPLVIWSAAGLQVSFSNMPHRRWLYGTSLIRGEITYEAAPGGVGKTAHTVGMAVEIATGTDVLGEKIWGHDLKVFYINAEDSQAEINRRVCAFCLAHAHKLAGQNLGRLSVLGVDDPRVQSLSFLRVNDRGATVLNEAGFDVLKSALEALRPDVLMLDPLVAFCGGGNMNDNAVMALVSRELKRLAAKFDCAILINHHTRKGSRGSDAAGDAEEISGASSIVNLSRRALMLKPMMDDEAKLLGVLPSERPRYLKLIDAKSNLAPRSADSPWYRLHSVTLPNPEPPIYPHGDNVQAIVRVHLPVLNSAAATADDQKIRDAILDLVDRGKMIDGQSYPYSPSLAGAQNARALLDDAVAAVADATAAREWPAGDLKATTERAIAKMKEEGLLVEEQMPGTGRFRRGRALRVDKSRIPSSDTGSDGSAPSGDPTAREEKEVDKQSTAPTRPPEMSPADKAAARAAAAERKAKGK
jgi:AAA domain